ncbi:hypothetical protein M3Y94_00696100 [Aphelenchoides besseyi]|nr:hypothetical protein M3Y94_00696100 [Aphelenchoides besseyi]
MTQLVLWLFFFVLIFQRTNSANQSTPVPLRSQQLSVQSAKTPVYAQPLIVQNPRRPISGGSSIGVPQQTETSKSTSRNMSEISSPYGSHHVSYEGRQNFSSLENRILPPQNIYNHTSRFQQHSTPKVPSIPPFRDVIDASEIQSVSPVDTRPLQYLYPVISELEDQLYLMDSLRDKMHDEVRQFIRTERDGWIAETKRLENDRKLLKAEVSKLQRELKHEQQERARMQRLINTADKRQEEAVKKVVDEVQSMKEELVKKSKLVAEWRQKHEKIMQRLQTKETEFGTVTQELDRSNESLRNNASRVTKLRLENDRLKRELATIRAAQNESVVNESRQTARPSTSQPQARLHQRSNSLQNLTMPPTLRRTVEKPAPIVQRPVRFHARTNVREISPQDSRTSVVDGCPEGCSLLDFEGHNNRFIWSCAFETDLKVLKNGECEDRGAYQIFLPGIGRAVYFASGQLAIDWDMDGMRDNSTTVFMQVQHTDGVWRDARLEVHREKGREVREVWSGTDDGEWFGELYDANNQVLQSRIRLEDARPYGNPELAIERLDDRVWKITVGTKLLAYLQNQEFLRFKYATVDGYIRITICRCGQGISTGKKLPDAPERTAFNVKRLDKDGRVVNLCSAVGECAHLIACKTPAKKRNVRKIGKSAESLPLLPNKNKTEVKTAQEKTKEKPKTNEKAPAQEKPPTHEQSLSKDNPPSNSVDQAPGPPKEKSAVLDRTQKSQSTLNYKEYTAQSIEKSKDKKTKSAVEIKEKETKTAVEPKEKTNEKNEECSGTESSSCHWCRAIGHSNNNSNSGRSYHQFNSTIS